ncbi:MAG: HIT domain-containing protein [Pseudomonadota bacterium]
MNFNLHKQLEQDCFFVSDLKLCRVLLMNNSLFKWLILVPRIENAEEIIDLNQEDRQILMQEICFISTIMKDLFTPKKLNIGALGNLVPQLHIHVIARYEDDAAWANPVWGSVCEKYIDPQPLISQIVGAINESRI